MPTEKATTEKGKRRIRREMLSPYEMSLVQTAFGMSAQHTTSEPLREALVKIAKKLTNIDRMIVEEDLDECCPGSGGGSSEAPGSEKRAGARWPVASFQSHVLVRAGIGDEGRRKQE